MIAAVTPIHDAAFEGRGAWQGADFASPEEWTYRPSPATWAELEAAMRIARDSGRPIHSLTIADFPAPSFASAGVALRKDVQSGRGFVVIRGMPIERYRDEEAAIIYW